MLNSKCRNQYIFILQAADRTGMCWSRGHATKTFSACRGNC